MSGKAVEKAVYLGTFAHSKSLKELEIAHDAAIFVDESGKIVAVASGVADEARAREVLPQAELDREPGEADPDHQRGRLRHHLRPRRHLLADHVLDLAQHALIGRCCMDSLAPDYYRDAGPEESIAHTRATIAHIASIDPTHAIVKPIITPRFAPSCSSQLLTGLGKLQKETGLPVQTHISENKREIDLVAELFPESKSYAEVYDSHGLLGPKTVLAHAVHITDEERALIKERGAGISHCPVSNAALSSGMAAVRTWLDDGINVGLGTDVSGGYSPSVLEAVRQALMCSRNLAMGGGRGGSGEEEVECGGAVVVADLGGAKVVGMEGKVGAFE
ncbi:hypothetical protein VE04_07677, partial [Pseudogymnoascus sp. 24MN13]